ncbi:M91 family zinc metallopeptidase [Dactylosporangium sp. AC04546]|uniref:M91 family zinc metallopeptidase n=1 Tax=Dactylosporangium sp. AC04546 TaxID=2862460 RepID=UPI001EDD77B4|nr:M91 family zinc metallopeptidase [Dactylosporangium sp. AC04546]WVK89103.1 M91 family zinc metallopeptidase [Dactylosporangium sp. AC04546]
MPVDGPPPGPANEVPDPVLTPDTWRLPAQPDRVDAAGRGWGQVAAALAAVGDDVNAGAIHVLSEGWTGDSADTFDELRRRLVGDLDGAAARAATMASALRGMAAELLAAQRALATEWLVVEPILSYPAPDTAGYRVFHPRTDQEAAALLASAAACGPIRTDLDTRLAGHLKDLTTANEEFQRIAVAWGDAALGTVPLFVVPPEATGPGVIFDGDRVIVNTGAGDDEVQVTVDPATGNQVVVVNGERFTFLPGVQVVVRAGPGDDLVVVAPGATRATTLLGGTGDDEIRTGDAPATILGLAGRDRLYGGRRADRISGGAGRDYVDGGDGADRLSGGLGDDTVYGLGGDDRIDGGEGRDYLEGGRGGDVIDGGTDADVVSAGRDDDTVRGGGGDDVVYAGLGADTVDGGLDDDTVYGEVTDTRTGTEHDVEVEVSDAGRFIQVYGSGDFQDRVAADLDMLRSSPRGQQMLAALDRAHADSGGAESLSISEYVNPRDPNNSSAGRAGTANYIEYNPHLDSLGDRGDLPPAAVLYHEMAHVYDFMYDTLAPGVYEGADNPGIRNLEREAVGLPLDDGRLYPDHPYELTENGLRDELGWPRRERY